MDLLEKTIKYAKEKHRATNHMYNDKPYEYHLNMVYEVAEKFIHLIPEKDHENVLCGCWVHDIIEDARETYNDVKMATNEAIAELAYALTNEKGKNRAERGNDKYYDGIRKTPYATFIKLCDRIANFMYSIQTGSRMARMYSKETLPFIDKTYKPEYEEMFDLLLKLKQKS